MPAVLQPRESRRARRVARAPEQMQLRGPREPHQATSQDGFQHCYNAQLVMDADSQLIVAAAVSPRQRPGPGAGFLDAGQDEYGHILTRVGSVAELRRVLNRHHPEFRDSDC